VNALRRGKKKKKKEKKKEMSGDISKTMTKK